MYRHRKKEGIAPPCIGTRYLLDIILQSSVGGVKTGTLLRTSSASAEEWNNCSTETFRCQSLLCTLSVHQLQQQGVAPGNHKHDQEQRGKLPHIHTQ